MPLRSRIGSRLCCSVGDVAKFYPKDAAENPDAVLEQAVGEYTNVLIIWWDKDGELDARASLGLKSNADLLWLLECFKANLMSGVYSDGED